MPPVNFSSDSLAVLGWHNPTAGVLALEQADTEAAVLLEPDASSSMLQDKRPRKGWTNTIHPDLQAPRGQVRGYRAKAFLSIQDLSSTHSCYLEAPEEKDHASGPAAAMASR